MSLSLEILLKENTFPESTCSLCLFSDAKIKVSVQYEIWIQSFQCCTSDHYGNDQDLTGHWSPWSHWSPCSVTCGSRSGIHTRERQCTGDNTRGCFGPDSQVKQCFTDAPCDGDVGRYPCLLAVHGHQCKHNKMKISSIWPQRTQRGRQEDLTFLVPIYVLNILYPLGLVPIF